MASSIIPEFFSSTNNHYNNNNNSTTLLFPNNNNSYYYSELSGGPVPPPAEDFAVLFFDNNFGGFGDGFSSSSSSSEKLEIVSDGVVPEFSAEYINNNIINNNMSSNNNEIIFPGAQNYLNNYGLEYNINVPLDNNGFDQLFGDEYCSADPFLPEFKPFSSLVAGEQKNWGIVQSSQMNGESNIMKVSRYSEEERKERIVRYLKKRNQRNFNKTIKYACRKTLADRRVRVRGRFARNNELCDHHDDQQIITKKVTAVDNPTRKDMKLCCDDALQMIKYDDDEDWLQNFALCCWVNESNISST